MPSEKNSINNKTYLGSLKDLFVLNLYFCAAMSLVRYLGYLSYADAGLMKSFPKDVLHAFILGIRFDWSFLCYVAVLPFLILSLIALFRRPWLFAKTLNFIRIYYVLFFFLILTVLAVDWVYYSYFQDHLNIMIYGFFEDDTTALIKTFWKNYPLVQYGFLWSALFCGLWFFVKKFFGRSETLLTAEKRIRKNLIAFVFALAFISAGARGTFALFPLSIADTVISTNPFINHLSYNGLHSLIRAMKLRKSQSTWDANWKYYGYTDIKKAFADYFQVPVDKVPNDPLTLLKKQTAKNPWAGKTKPHVVVFVMESMGDYWLRFHSASFDLLGELDRHFSEDLVLHHFFPTASATIGSLSSLMISVPQRPGSAFLTEDRYLQVSFESSPAQIYKKAGYQTRFIYGGNPGWRDINKFALQQGFDSVEGEVDIEQKLGSLKEKHDWGVFDEDLFRYVETLLKEAQKPQMLLVMSTTNHPPYPLPSTYKKPNHTLPENLKSRLVGDLDLVSSRFACFQYSNQKLGEFLRSLKSSPLKDSTVVAATGDHGFWLVNFSEEELLQKWAVPFYLYIPKAARKPLDAKKTFASHMDVFPTLYEMTLSEAPYMAFGSNIFDPRFPNHAFHTSRLVIGPAGGAYALKGSENSFFAWRDGFEKLVPAEATAERELMAQRYKALMTLADYYLMKEYEQRQRHTAKSSNR